MAILTRKTQKVFASAASDIGQFGSGAAGTKVITTDPTVVQALSAWVNGWLVATLGANKFPALEEMNGVAFVATYQLAYILQEGIPEYDVGTTYSQFGLCKKAGTFDIYGSLATNNVGNALTDNTKWSLLVTLGGGGSLTPTVGSNTGVSASVTAAGTSATFAATEVVVKVSLGGAGQTLENYSQAVNLATTGAGGMDTGTAPVSGYVSIYAIAKPDGTKSILACNASTSSTPIYSGANMPATYTYSALISIWPTNGSSQFIVAVQAGRKVWFPMTQALLQNGSTATSYTSFSLAGVVPPTAKTVSGNAGASTSSTSGNLAIAADTSGTGEKIFVNVAALTGAAFDGFTAASPFEDMPIITSQSAFYKAYTGSESIRVNVNAYTF